MASTLKKTTPSCHHHNSSSSSGSAPASIPRCDNQSISHVLIASLIPPDSALNASNKGIQIFPSAESSHPLNPLSVAEISVAVATVRSAGATPEVRDGMRFVEVVLSEPDEKIVALADAYFFRPFQQSLFPRKKGAVIIPSKLPARRARLVVYNKKSNETSIWIVELYEVRAATRGGHHRGKVIASQVVRDVHPAMDVEIRYNMNAGTQY